LRDDAKRTLDTNFPGSTVKLGQNKAWWKLW
jgi:hypothetical protein